MLSKYLVLVTTFLSTVPLFVQCFYLRSFPPLRSSHPLPAESLCTSFTSVPFDYHEDELATPRIHAQVKLPVWPVYSGVVAQVLEWMGLPSLSDALLSRLGGRVVPMPLDELDISPFLLLVHHTHSFMPFDPVRPITNMILPEGFPAHPHSGFGTLTFTLKGGLKHRDSEGVQMQYRNGDAQWMKAGKGVIHEEMWDIPENKFERIEIFQLWINSPSSEKFVDPSVEVLRDNEIPRLKLDEMGSELRVLYGSVNKIDKDMDDSRDGVTCSGPGDRVADSPLCISHLTLAANSKQFVRYTSDCSFACYVQRGNMKLDGVDVGETRMGNIITYESRNGESASPRSSIAVIESGDEGLECLILIGKKLQERVVMGGPYVASSEAGYNHVARAWRAVGNDAFWDFRLSDDEWRRHINKIKLQERLSQLNSSQRRQ